MKLSDKLDYVELKIKKAESFLKEAKDGVNYIVDGDRWDNSEPSEWKEVNQDETPFVLWKMKDSNYFTVQFTGEDKTNYILKNIKTYDTFRREAEKKPTPKEKNYLFLKRLTDKYPLLLGLTEIKQEYFFYKPFPHSKKYILNYLMHRCYTVVNAIDPCLDLHTIKKWCALAEALEVELNNLDKPNCCEICGIPH